jgi:hypothetical protein
MYDIKQNDVTDEFVKCWMSAGRYLDSQKGELIWLRTHLAQPMIEHLSFRLGNQIFFIQIFDVDENLMTPTNNINGLISFSKECKAIPCLLPMKKTDGEWSVENDVWGLIDPETNKQIIPESFITDESVEMTDWEVQDGAVMIVKNKIEESGKELMSWQSNPQVHPSLWFVGDNGPEYVVVSSARYPEEALPPKNIDDIKESNSRMSGIGYFASVVLASSDDPFDPEAKDNGNFLPLIRGEGFIPKVSDLIPLTID